MDEGVEESGHNEVSDSTTSVSDTGHESVRRSDHGFVEESGTPHLARNEGSTEDTNKESQNEQTGGIGNSSSKSRWNCTSEENCSVDISRAIAITERSYHGAHHESCSQGQNIRVADLFLGKMEVSFDSFGHLVEGISGLPCERFVGL